MSLVTYACAGGEAYISRFTELVVSGDCLQTGGDDDSNPRRPHVLEERQPCRRHTLCSHQSVLKSLK